MGLEWGYAITVMIIAGVFLVGVIFRVVAQLVIRATEEDLKEAIEEAVTPEELNQARRDYDLFQAQFNRDKATRRPY